MPRTRSTTLSATTADLDTAWSVIRRQAPRVLSTGIDTNKLSAYTTPFRGTLAMIRDHRTMTNPTAKFDYEALGEPNPMEMYFQQLRMRTR